VEFRQQPDEPTPRTEAASPAVPEQREAPHVPAGPPQFAPPPAAPPPAAPPPAPPARGRRGWSKLKLVLAVLAGVLSLLCIGGLGVGFVLYDQATRIDRSAPDVVVDNYLRALLVERNDAEAALFACSETASLASIAELRQEVERRERDFGVVVRTSWGSLVRTSVSETEELVRTDLTVAGVADGQQRSSRTESWEFRVVDQDGWRVCGARKL
jgi:hypothetical protein